MLINQTVEQKLNFYIQIKTKKFKNLQQKW